MLDIFPDKSALQYRNSPHMQYHMMNLKKKKNMMMD